MGSTVLLGKVFTSTFPSPVHKLVAIDCANNGSLRANPAPDYIERHSRFANTGAEEWAQALVDLRTAGVIIETEEGLVFHDGKLHLLARGDAEFARTSKGVCVLIYDASDLEGIDDEIEGRSIRPRPSYRKRISPALRLSIYERDGHKCLKCGATEDLTIDHKHPARHGGTNDPSNLQTLCWSCNHKKRDRIE